MEFREATKEDLAFAAEHSVSKAVKGWSERADYVYTLDHEGEVLMTGGFRMVNETTAWCWVNMTDRREGHIKTCYRVMDEWITEFIKDHELIRLQAYVRVDFPEAVDLVQHLGFEQEGPPMKKFVGDIDAFMYVRIKE